MQFWPNCALSRSSTTYFLGLNIPKQVEMERWCWPWGGGENQQILITRRQRLVLNLETLPLPQRPHSFCSETHCRGGFSPRWMRALGSCASYSRSIFHPADALNHCWKSPCLPSSVVSLCRRRRRRQHHLPSPTLPKKGTCLLQSFIISLVCWWWSQCRAAWRRLRDRLRCKITGLAPRPGPNASLPLFLLCRPARSPDVHSWQYN